MQYVRSISGSVSKTWNSINPATLSGAIDVIVVEQEDGKIDQCCLTMSWTNIVIRIARLLSVPCSIWQVLTATTIREKGKNHHLESSYVEVDKIQVEFRVNDAKQEYAMKLGDGGEAFFVFETLDDIPEALQTSPLISPATSPNATAMGGSTPNLQEPDYLDLTTEEKQTSSVSNAPVMPILPPNRRVQSDIGRSFLDITIVATSDSRVLGNLTPLSQSPNDKELRRPQSGDWSGPETVMPKPIPLERSTSDRVLSLPGNLTTTSEDPLKSHIMLSQIEENGSGSNSGTRHRSIGERSNSPPLLSYKEAVDRAKSLSQKLSGSNIPTQVTDTGDLKLDMTGYKSSEDEVLRAEIIARKILAEELEGNYDIGALIGADEQGNLWIYSSEEAKEAAGRKAELQQYGTGPILTGDSASDPGYHSDNEKSAMPPELEAPQHRRDSDAAAAVLMTPPQTPPEKGTAGDPNRNYAKTLRLTSDQLKALQLRSGANSMSFTVNRATCTAYMFYWKHDIPIVISDIDGTITK
jgi:phosphatidate phosphatase LPIN